jgi:hypothetical protein
MVPRALVVARAPKSVYHEEISKSSPTKALDDCFALRRTGALASLAPTNSSNFSRRFASRVITNRARHHGVDAGLDLGDLLTVRPDAQPEALEYAWSTLHARSFRL